MRAQLSIAVVMGLSFAGAGCFGSDNPTPPVPDGATADDGAAEMDAPAPEAGADSPTTDAAPGDAPVDTSASLDSPAEAAPETDATLDAPADSPVDAFSPEGAADAGGGFVRVADMVPDLGSIDFCVKASSAPAFGSPYMGLQGGLTVPYQAVSEYDALAPASGYTVRIVAGGASDCSTGLAADVTVGPSPATAPSTVVLEGTSSDAGTPLRVLALTDDDPATSPAGETRMRAVHTAPATGAVGFQIGVTPHVEALQVGVPYGATFAAATAASGAPTPDAQGYVTPGYGQAQVVVVLGGVEATSFYVGDGVVPTASTTAFLVGASGSTDDPLGFVSCDELGTPDATTHLSPCSFSSAAPATLDIRVFHGSPDQGAVDVCAGLGPTSQPFSANLLQAAGVSGGLAFGQLTGDLTTMPARTDIKLGFVLANQVCATENQFMTVGTGLPGDEWVYAMQEVTPPPSVQYGVDLFDSLLAPDDADDAEVELVNVTSPPGGPSIDLYATGHSGPIEFASAVSTSSASGFSSLPSDAYALRVEDDATQTDLYSTTGAQLNAGEDYILFWLEGSSPQGVLARCALSQRSADAVTSCPY